MSSNETYLEKFIESISTVPTEIQRNLQHMKSLDEQYSQTTEDLRDAQEEYLGEVYNVIHSLQVDLHPQRKKLKLQEVKDGTQDDTILGGTTTSTSRSSSTADKPKDETDKEQDEIEETAKEQETTDNNDTDSDNESKEAFDLTNPLEGIIVPLSSSSQQQQQEEKETKKLMIATTEELRQMTQNKAALLEIASLRQTTQQITAEKLSTTNQNLKIVNSILSKLNQDITEYETLLKATGQYQDSQGCNNIASLYVDQLAAIQVVANSQEWILAKVMQHDEHTGMYHLGDEDIESNKTFILPESQVVILGGLSTSTLNRNDKIYAVYPDTTSFYQASVVEMTKNNKGKDPLVLVHFKDDGDEHGITHAKAVPMKHVMKVPYGAIQA